MDDKRNETVCATKRAGNGLRGKTSRVIRWLLMLRGSPEAIGRGIAIGTFVAFTPTIGLQMVIAVVLATLLHANRPAAIAPVWISNPFTIPPMFLLTYWVGTFLWPGPSLETVRETLKEALRAASEHHTWQITDQVKLFLSLGWDIFMCLTLGGILVGAVAGGLSYFPAVWLVRDLRSRWHRRKTRHASRAASTSDANRSVD